MARNACPRCGGELGWVIDEDVISGGWYQCENDHQWLRRFGGWVPLDEEN
jgi:hypothetical protein